MVVDTQNCERLQDLELLYSFKANIFFFKFRLLYVFKVLIRGFRDEESRTKQKQFRLKNIISKAGNLIVFTQQKLVPKWQELKNMVKYSPAPSLPNNI